VEGNSRSFEAFWATPVRYLRGVGPEREKLLAKLGIRTIGDLLLHRPRRHEDRRRFAAIAELRLGEPAAVKGRVAAMGVKRLRRTRRSLFELILEDGNSRLHCRWWNAPYMQQYFRVGEEIVAFGKPSRLKPPTMDQPEAEAVDEAEPEAFVHLGRLVPIYPATEGLSQRALRTLVWRALEQSPPLPEPRGLPAPEGMLSYDAAVRRLHFPENEEDVEAARRRLAYEELFALQLELQRRRWNLERKARAPRCAGDNRLIRPFVARLGFQLTEAQVKVLREIRRDMAGPAPMRRLLQGDVGSGKTVAAACAALMAMESGFDAVFMAPTEVLAEQQRRAFCGWFEPLGLEVALLTGERKILPEDRPLFCGSGPENRRRPVLYVGTHALLHYEFDPERLGLVIIDEQHKFGVYQRTRLLRKGRCPHLLVMTATPIPRTLGLTLYGDLDVSTIDASPPGRGRLRTFVRREASLPKIWRFVREQLEAGRQAYIVYPRLQENDEDAGIKAVLQEHSRLERLLAPHPLGLLHGKLSAQEKTRVMQDFREGRLAALVATSVIEVGLDVPNATVMVVENADRFGLAQLHQLRGRIGRGPYDAYCILVSSAKNPEAKARLKAMEETADGFRIAEADLRLRGPGEFLGSRQSGPARLRFADLTKDLELARLARDRARAAVRGQAGGGLA